MWPFHKEPEVSKFNLINQHNQVLPNYDLGGKELSIELHFSPDKQVCIMGRVDGNYISWCSLTEVDDEEKNEKIFNYLAENPIQRVSNESSVLGQEKFKDMQNWYHCEIKKSPREGILWETPFGSAYGSEGTEYHGSYFAANIRVFYQERLEKCSFRTSGGFYIELLRHYLQLLEQAEEYADIKPLISILEQESYVRVSPDQSVRKLYCECMKRGRFLYNRYMDRAR